MNLKKAIRTALVKTDTLLLNLFSFIDRMGTGNKKGVLILRTDNLGDFIIFSPFLSGYKKNNHGQMITLLLSEACHGLLKELDLKKYNVDRYLIIDRDKFKKNLAYRIGFLYKIFRLHFKVVVYPVFSRDYVGDLLCQATNATNKITFTGDTSNLEMKVKIRNDARYTRLVGSGEMVANELEKNIIFHKQLGINIGNYEGGDIKIEEQSRKRASLIIKNALAPNQKFYIVCPGAGSAYRIWQSDKYAEVIRYINQQFGFRGLLCGSLNEADLCQSILEKVPQETVANLAGKLSIMTLAAVLKKSEFYLGSESGIVHLAAALRIPTVCIIGGGHLGRFFPYGDLSRNRIVYDKNVGCVGDNWSCVKNIKDNGPAPCIKDITPQEVIKEVNWLLEQVIKHGNKK